MTNWMEFIFGGWMACFCVTLSVRVSMFISGCTWIPIMDAWQWSHKGHNNLTKLNMIANSIWVWFCNVNHHMALVGIYHHLRNFYGFWIFENKYSGCQVFLRTKLQQILCRPYRTPQQLRQVSCNCNPQDSSFQDETFLANKFKSWRKAKL